MTTKRNEDGLIERYGNFIYLAIATVAGAGAATYGQTLIHGNDQAINVIVTVFSILAGFLVAIIAVTGNRELLPGEGWQLAELGRQRQIDRLVRYKWLFFAYLLTLGLIFVSLLIKDLHSDLTLFLERSYLFLAVLTFVLSLRLPWSLAKIQEERIEILIARLRREQGIDDHPDSI